MSRILLMKEPRRQVKIYLHRLFLPLALPVLANIHLTCLIPLNRVAAYLYDLHDVALLAQFRFNVGPVSQPIAGSMPTNCLRRWLNTTPTLGRLYNWRQHPSKHMPFTQNCFKVGAGPTLKQNWVIVPYCYVGDVLLLPSPEKPQPR